MKRYGLILPGLLTLAIALAAPAAAAPGTITVNGMDWIDPAGCVNVVPTGMNLEVHNDTSGAVTVYTHADCQGDATGTVDQGSTNTFYGASVMAP
ncbi:hypothetical protein [Nocardia sp. NPDC127526]|uniref:hypothetical protein n=1 Tax=Nocardia sp. NPDC127526 TaxID=3345393 RepID=UPI0036267E73